MVEKRPEQRITNEAEDCGMKLITRSLELEENSYRLKDRRPCVGKQAFFDAFHRLPISLFTAALGNDIVGWWIELRAEEGREGAWERKGEGNGNGKELVCGRSRPVLRFGEWNDGYTREQ